MAPKHGTFDNILTNCQIIIEFNYFKLPSKLFLSSSVYEILIEGISPIFVQAVMLPMWYMFYLSTPLKLSVRQDN